MTKKHSETIEHGFTTQLVGVRHWQRCAVIKPELMDYRTLWHGDIRLLASVG